jgi:hypothetical protein
MRAVRIEWGSCSTGCRNDHSLLWELPGGAALVLARWRPVTGGSDTYATVFAARLIRPEIGRQAGQPESRILGDISGPMPPRSVLWR